MSYNSRGTRGVSGRVGRTIRAATEVKSKPKETKKAKETKKSTTDRLERLNDRKETKRNNEPKKPSDRSIIKRLTKAQLDRLKEHSKLHGGMSSRHMRKMIFVMTRENKSFSEAHKIAMKFDKMKK
jgi:hypothetical protein